MLNGAVATADVDGNLAKLLRILDRHEQIPALESLAFSVKGEVKKIDLKKTAIVLDANVFLRIPAHKKSSDIIDYLSGPHEKPVVVPGQAIQEFWNNQLSAIDTVYKTVSKKYNDMSREVDKFKNSGVSSIELVEASLEAFKQSNEHIFEPDLINKTSLFLESLIKTAIVPYAPRAPLGEIAIARKRAKTPPGFKDDGDGDFLVWVDLLWGLLVAKAGGHTFENVILLSHDSKIDWSRGKIAHPILIAELRAALDAHFEIWTLDQLAVAISEN